MISNDVFPKDIAGNRHFSGVEVSPTWVVSFAYTVYDISGDSPGHFCETPRDSSC